MSIFTIIENKHYTVAVTLQPGPRNNHVFTSFDTLRGVVTLTPHKKLFASAIESIDISFQGFTRSALPGEFIGIDISRLLCCALGRSSRRPQVDRPLLQTAPGLLENNLNIECHQLVHVGQKLFSREKNQGAQFLPENQYCYEFSLLIPSEAACCLGENHSLAFHVDSLTNAKIALQHRKNLFMDQDVLHYQLPPSLSSASSSKKDHPLDRWYNVVYFLKVAVGASAKSKSSSAGYHEITFIPRESSVDVCNRDRHSEQPMWYQSPNLFSVCSRDSAAFESYKKNCMDISLEETLFSKQGRFGSPFKSRKAVVSHKFARFSNLPMYLELRFYDSEYLTPSTTPNFRLFLVSPQDPNSIMTISLTHRIAALVLQNLQIDIVETTKLTNQTDSTASNLRFNRVSSPEFLSDSFSRKINLFKSEDWLNHEILLQTINRDDIKTRTVPAPTGFTINYDRISNVTHKPVYEYEISMDSFVNHSVNANGNGIIIPQDICPSFKSCNIKRDYKFLVSGEFSSLLDSDYPYCLATKSTSECPSLVSSDSGSDSSRRSSQELESPPILLHSPSDNTPFSMFKKANLFASKHSDPIVKDLLLVSCGAHVKILSGISNIIDAHYVNRDLNYTLADIMDLAPRHESLPSYDEAVSHPSLNRPVEVI